MSMEPETDETAEEVYETPEEVYENPEDETMDYPDNENADYPDNDNADYEVPEDEPTPQQYQSPEGDDQIGEPNDDARPRGESVGAKMASGLKATGRWIKGAGIRFGHKVKNEDWGGEIKRGGASTGKAVKDSFIGMGKGIKSLGKKDERSAMWSKTKASWAKQWRLAKKSLSKAIGNLKDKDKRSKLFEGMKRSTQNSFKSAGEQMKGYKSEMATTSKANQERGAGVPSTGRKVSRPPPVNEQIYAEATEAPAAAYTRPPSDIVADDPAPAAGDDTEKTKYQAMYNYDAGNEDELSLTKGETIYALAADEIGWLMATNEEGTTGLIPSNYVSIM